jgi:hypothetical protein
MGADDYLLGRSDDYELLASEQERAGNADAAARFRQEAKNFRTAWRWRQPGHQSQVIFTSNELDCRSGFCTRIGACMAAGRCLGKRQG